MTDRTRPAPLVGVGVSLRRALLTGAALSAAAARPASAPVAKKPR